MKVLVLGDGILGSEIVKQTQWDFLSRKKGNFDVNDINSWNFLGYDVVVNCIAHTDTYSKERDIHWNLNYVYVYNLIQYCNKHKIKLVHISTVYLYASNSKDFCSELDVPVHDENWYSYTKLLGDGITQLLSDKYLLCRCMHKPTPFPYDSAWIDQVGNFDSVDVISGIIIKCIEQELCGLYNIGTELKSIFTLAQKTNPNVKAILSPKNVTTNVTISIEKLNRDIR